MVRTIARLRHPHLVRVVNFFESNDTAYLVMDYYEGEDLGRHLKPPRKGQPGVRLPWRRAVALLLPVLAGLEKVHQAGFMHRDIKPGNLYLTHDDELILLDFGSARQVTGTHTRSLLIFSEGFAPYEQYLQGHLNRQGPWTDVYAVAATLYFMLTAQRPPSALDRKQATLLQQPELLKPARHFLPDLPPALDAALLRALAVEPEQRLQSITAFKQHLETALAEDDKPRPTPPPEPPTRPQAAPQPSIPPKAASESTAKPPRPETPPPPKAAPERSSRSNWGSATTAIAVVGLIAWGGWSIGLRTPPDLPKPPMVATPSVAESPPIPAPPPAEPVPTVEPRAYLTVKTEPPEAQVRIMNIDPAYRDGIELAPGDFDIEVSAPGYRTDRAWHALAAGAQELKIALPAEPSAPAAVPRSSFEPEVVRIPGGCFEMGSPASEADRDDDERQHRVCVDAFEVGRYEVTQGQWQAAMGDNPSRFKRGDDHPVENVSWNDVQTYLQKLNARTGRTYRLPTEAEWEYACRGGMAGQRYCGGDGPERLAWHNANSGNQVHPVGQKAANGFGLYDMSGNIWEWTCSLYDKSYSGAESDCADNNTGGPRSLRGGSWRNDLAWVRSANRGGLTPAGRNDNAGFRLARSL
ncbi:MAG: bifunctional serine/threonine-protein kinase/formylglycine-generating enzyme family protein [Candidatus Competibacter sp.]|nr:bifunctional serine/threonine-protein kinase/formylglycine-generating enzyme family protein [Candidatus Competibacter sp.]MDG4585145.1 bifunctional serine/threonine-protein kinase/formylglycine-generating enzyme family protein [Candidatus Competibacter sp.]